MAEGTGYLAQLSVRARLAAAQDSYLSPKNDKEPRAHADYVELGDILPFLRDVAAMTPQLDVMIEAKRKDDALFRLIDELKTADGIELVDQSSVLVRAL